MVVKAGGVGSLCGSTCVVVVNRQFVRSLRMPRSFEETQSIQ